MSLQFDPRLLLEESEQRLEDTKNKLASVSATVSKGVLSFPSGSRNQFTRLVREEANLIKTIPEIKNNIRLLKREIELRTTPFISQASAIIQPESIDVDPQIIIQKIPAIDLKTAAIIGGVLLVLS